MTYIQLFTQMFIKFQRWYRNVRHIHGFI